MNDGYVFFKHDCRRAWRKYLFKQQWDFFVTLNFNQQRGFDSAAAALKEFEARINRKMLGREWHKMPMEQRITFYAFPEHPDSNLHYHLLVRVPQPDRFRELAPQIWTTLVPSGQADIRVPDDWQKVVRYVTKCQRQTRLMENVVMAGQFKREFSI